MHTSNAAILSLLIATTAASAETDLHYIEQHAIDAPTSQFSDELKHSLSQYQVILVGEMHGSTEPMEAAARALEINRLAQSKPAVSWRKNEPS